MRTYLQSLPAKLKISLIFVAFWGVWISGVLGSNGLLQAYRLAKVRRELALRVRALDNEKTRLQSLLASLRNDPFSQEMAIRDTLGYVRDGEVVFEIEIQDSP